MTRPCFYSVTSLMMLICGGFTLDGSADTSGGLREFKQIFLFITKYVLMKAITQRESVVTCIKSCLIFQIPRFMLIRPSKYRVISPSSIKFQLTRLEPDLSYEVDCFTEKKCLLIRQTN